ncbi:MAG TPA: glycosyltransferase [Thermoanaerobaculia bacterium]|nr:glycosyltransferase [Thermoanaerobaculia bacterium]
MSPGGAAVPEISVVVPTHDRLDTLPEVLGALAAQRDAPAFGVVVVDDGSTDGTAAWLETFEWPPGWRFVRQENRGPAAARNAGVRLARGRWVAFLGDDTVPEAGWLAAHHRTLTGEIARRAQAAGQGVGVIGYTGWHPRMRLNPFLRYINEHGLQFGYALIEDPDDVPFNFLYTSNLSLERALLLEEPFDLDFPYAAWEDIELSYRLKRRGLRLLYQASARVAHHHPTDLARFCARQEKAGYCAVVFHRLHPELGGFLGLGPDGPPPLPNRGLQALARGLASALLPLPVRLPGLWECVLRYHYVVGLRRGWRDLGGRAKGDAA